MAVNQKILGLDLGIASCGWAVLEIGDGDGRIIAAGARCWEAPEVDRVPSGGVTVPVRSVATLSGRSVSG